MATTLDGAAAASECGATPPPSPSAFAAWDRAPSVSMLEDGEMSESDAQEADDAADDSDDSDYTPGGATTKKKAKRRRLVHGSAKNQKRKARRSTTASVSQDDGGDKAEAEDVAELFAEPRPSRQQPKAVATKRKREESAATWADDGSLDLYRRRLHELRRELQDSAQSGRASFYNKPRPASDDNAVASAGDQAFGPATEFYSPYDQTETASGLAVPRYVLTQLLPHQRECLEWLHGLHERGVGGILGDDMGLGKTVQLAAFLGALHGARRLRSVLLLCPASVLLQWVRELHKWVPWLRVVLLHASGTGVRSSSASATAASYNQLIDEVFRYQDEDSDGASSSRAGSREPPTAGGVVITTYESVRQYQELFLPREWDYVVLDEGHRIRNPDAEITLACKQLQTVHRVILSGTPIQNRLRELWSLFDFVYPGRLGTLPTFDDEFVLPIRAGGYATASKMQVLMAYKCALALKDLIRPFLLRRTKQEVLASDAALPGKREQILFCRLTGRQRALYRRFLASPEVAAVLRRDVRPFRAISVLRHICNHPDLLASFGDGRLADKRTQAEDEQVDAGLAGFLTEAATDLESERFGAATASGKMLVLQKVLALWKTQGHRVLLFTQTRRMLDILESFMWRLGHACCRLDGTTTVGDRQSRLDAFNAADSHLFVFLLTTRAGGIGVNLVGADRVVVFDPDWNPSTDLQARERAWRIGQHKPVTVYRLVTAGTIEEKIYHRQIFKQYLTSKVLHDAKRKRCFNKHSLRDLFVLADEPQEGDGAAETSELFVAGHVARPDDAPVHEHEDGQVSEEDARVDVDGDASTQRQRQRERDKTEAGDNDAVLQQLFDGGEVKAVFDHAAVESDGVQNQEAELVEMEATKVAQSALSALRASGAFVRQQRESAFTPTWTGRSGAAGDPSRHRQQRRPAAASRRTTPLRPSAPASRGRGIGGRGLRGRALQGRGLAGRGQQNALSSREMLNRIQQRRDGVAAQVTQGGSHRPMPLCVGTRAVGAAALTADEMTRRLHAFLATHAAQGVTTEGLLESFGDVVAPKDKLVFRHVLRDLAVCRRRRWTLKPEYTADSGAGAPANTPAVAAAGSTAAASSVFVSSSRRRR